MLVNVNGEVNGAVNGAVNGEVEVVTPDEDPGSMPPAPMRA